MKKTPKDYLKTQQANELIEAISSRTNVLVTDLVQIKKGGEFQGTTPGMKIWRLNLAAGFLVITDGSQV